MREEVEASIRMIKHSFVEGTFVRLNINTGEEIPLTADMCLEPIIKDLEVLEILKKNTDVELLKANENAPIFITVLRVKPLTNTVDKEYQKVKEWLEND